MIDSRQEVVDAIRDLGPISLREIEQRTGLGRTTVGGLVADLRAQGAVVTQEADRGSGGTGRPPMIVSLNPDLARVIGVQYEHTHVLAAVADLGFTLRDRERRPMPVADDIGAALAASAEMIEGLLRRTGVPKRLVIGAAMALAAPIDVRSGTVKTSSALSGWVGRKPAEELGRLLQLPVRLDNDATLAGFGEAVKGAGRGSRHVVYVKLSATVGCGIIIDGLPYGGFAGTAGELAHVVVDESGPLCFCGNRGCLNRVVGAEALLADLESVPGPRIRSQGTATADNEPLPRTIDRRLEQLIAWARDGDPACQRVIGDAARHVGIALVNVCNLLNPETIVVGGVLSTAGDALFFDPLRAWVHLCTRHLPGPVNIRPPELGEEAEVVGAGALVLRSNTPAFRRRLATLLDSAGTDAN